MSIAITPGGTMIADTVDEALALRDALAHREIQRPVEGFDRVLEEYLSLPADAGDDDAALVAAAAQEAQEAQDDDELPEISEQDAALIGTTSIRARQAAEVKARQRARRLAKRIREIERDEEGI